MRELRESQAVMINTVTELGSTVQTLATHGTRTGNSNNKLKLTESKLWRLVGYCQARSPAHLPGVWVELFKLSNWSDQADALNRAVGKISKATNVVVSSCTLNRRETTMKQILSQENPVEHLTMSNQNDDWGIHTYLPKSEVDQESEKDEEYAPLQFGLQTFEN